VCYITHWINNENIKNVIWGMRDIFNSSTAREQFECDKHLTILSTKIPLVDPNTTFYKSLVSALVTLIMVKIFN